MKIVFRTDSSHQIGSGHVMRSLTLADALKEQGCDCAFVSRLHPGNLNELIRQRGYGVHELAVCTREASRKDQSAPELAHGEWLGGDWASDVEETKAAIGERGADCLVVDHYALDEQWETALRPHCAKIMVIDDLADRKHDCDLLLDQNLVADMEQRYEGKLPANCGRMLGPEYALLKPEYSKLRDEVSPRKGQIRGVLVYFGGADSVNLTGMAIDAFLSLQRNDVQLDVVINPEGPNSTEIRMQVEGNDQIKLHESLPSLAPLLAKADLGIGAGGATSWERCCLGLPTLVITLAENQKPSAAELDRNKLVRWLGHKDEVSEVALANALKELLDSELSPEWSERCRKQVDGRGVERVWQALLQLAQNRCTSH